MISDDIREIITVVLVLVSALMCFAAGVGLMRFPDVLSRLHAATKPQILGLMAIAAAVAVNNATIATFALLTAIIIFQALTAPITAHMVGRAAYRSDHLRRDLLIRDELSDSVDRAEQDGAPPAPHGTPPAPRDDRPSG
ncbi:monovalent cation/H(+) antiporter subunit G [Mycetocola miduiensis]|uniref:Multisubunit sodium/proton antiporter, MrpG subunit n=1 Tax=Mycetocola miduiensis TaxID=995034 RepID=A0A1I5D7R9_9MICO|nr:monovalent cation/H(+) antiporter subunit G [Mycetocola miduiensis]SFN95240.1 multisubunit sodium/proton antiporter, MrpG subunit [Mycetocola miduiensis]